MEYWNRKTFCLITGASRGIGKTIALEVSKIVAPGSIILLLARSKEGLEATRNEIIKCTNSQINVVTSSVDLSDSNYQKFKSILQSSLTQFKNKSSDFSHVIIFQNAASLGIQNGLKVAEINDIIEIQDYYAFNLNSFILLNTAFFNIFHQTDQTKQQRTAVHTSSAGALQPFKTWGLYCAAKAARDMLLKSMALESGIQTLNYAPGSVNTAIYDEAVKYTADPELAKIFEEDRKAGKILTCEQTVTKLIKVLAEQKFTKGEHISYHDVQ